MERNRAEVLAAARKLKLREARIDGKRLALADVPLLDRYKEHDVDLVVATLTTKSPGLEDELARCLRLGTGSVIGLDERVRAKIDGENCYGPAKMRMIADWVENSGLKGAHGHVRFYSDHASDAPVFEWSDEPVAVNPHARLARLAATRGWRVEDWG